MKLQNRIELLTRLGSHLSSNTPEWQEAVLNASWRNPWFTTDFVRYATTSIVEKYLNRDQLHQWVMPYVVNEPKRQRTIGIVMAGNIPMVGIHDLISVFISGHRQVIKLSSKDEVLMRYIIHWMYDQHPELKETIQVADQLKGCDAYICTGSAQTGIYFQSYFGKYPNIIRSNKTSVAILTGDETSAELALLADDVHLFFGLGCRNVTKIFVPESYQFESLLQAFIKYQHLSELDRYKNNFDYQLSILLLNQQKYMTNGICLLTESAMPFSPISVLHYETYKPGEDPSQKIMHDESIQCIVGKEFVPFGMAQQPALNQYADGVDTLHFLWNLF